MNNEDIIEVRKIQALTGERSFTLVFPKQFATELGVGRGDFMKCRVDSGRLIGREDGALKVQYIDKIGYFCDFRATDLLELSLAIKENEDYNVDTQLVSATEAKKLLQSDLRVWGSNHSIAVRPIKTSGDRDR
ncbi:MAG: hypothetical protein WA667_24875 [Candidatus Nitrosopolaris sp.]